MSYIIEPEHRLYTGVYYFHGSQDSTDEDVHFVFTELPERDSCTKFCKSTDREVSKNIIVIKDGIVSDSFFGTIDEVNNALFNTYSLHQQSFPLLVQHQVPRDIVLKDVKVIRGILSLLSRSQYREVIKKALKSSFSDRIATLNAIKLTSINFSSLNKGKGDKDILKTIAFQLAQAFGLHSDIEIYTKHSATEVYPFLYSFLYRCSTEGDIRYLEEFLHSYVEILMQYSVDETIVNGIRLATFSDYNETIDLNHEKIYTI